MSALTKLTRDQFIPYIDTSSTDTPSYKRIDLSTIFELAMNPVTEEYDYICYKNTVTEVTGNAPELPQEIALYEGNPVFDFMYGMFINLPVGEDCKVPFLMCFGGTGKKAWLTDATIVFDNLSSVDGKLSFTIKIGEPTQGTYTINSETGVPSFTPSTALKATPSSISIEKGETGTVVISGGTGEYTVSTETANITATLGLDGKTVTITTSVSSASSDTLTISDGDDEIEVPITCTTP